MSKPQPNKEQNKPEINATPKKWTRAEFISNIINGIIALGSIGAIIIATVALTENRQEFRTDNRPYLQIFRLDSFKIAPNTRAKFSYVIENLGKQPVKVLDQQLGDAYGDDAPYDICVTYTKYKPAADHINRYITKEHSVGLNFTSDELSDSTWYNEIKKGIGYYYFFGKIRYLNLVTNEVMMYYFNIKIKGVTMAAEIDILYNENIYYKEQ